MEEKLLDDKKFFIKWLWKQNENIFTIIQKAEADLKDKLKKNKQFDIKQIWNHQLYNPIKKFFEILFPKEDELFKLLEDFKKKNTINIEDIITKSKFLMDIKWVFYQVLFINIFLQVKLFFWEERINEIIRYNYIWTQRIDCNSLSCVEKFSIILFWQYKSNIFNKDILYRKKEIASLTRKIMTNQTHFNFLINKWMVNDIYWLTFYFENIKELKSHIKYFWWQIPQKNYVWHIDYWVFNKYKSLEKTLSLTNMNPFYNILIQAKDTTPIWEISFKLSPQAQLFENYNYLREKKITTNSTIKDKEKYRFFLLEKTEFLNHWIYKLIQDISVFLLFYDYCQEQNFKNFFEYKVEIVINEILEKINNHNIAVWEDNYVYIKKAVKEIIKKKLWIFKKRKWIIYIKSFFDNNIN